MKLYNIKVYDLIKKAIVLNIQERSNLKKNILDKYQAKYRFPSGKYKVTVTRLTREPGIQTNILDAINEIEPPTTL